MNVALLAVKKDVCMRGSTQRSYLAPLLNVYIKRSDAFRVQTNTLGRDEKFV